MVLGDSSQGGWPAPKCASTTDERWLRTGIDASDGEVEALDVAPPPFGVNFGELGRETTVRQAQEGAITIRGEVDLDHRRARRDVAEWRVDPTHVKTTREWGTSSTNSPTAPASGPLPIAIRSRPPGRASSVAAVPCQRDHRSASVKNA